MKTDKPQQIYIYGLVVIVFTYLLLHVSTTTLITPSDVRFNYNYSLVDSTLNVISSTSFHKNNLHTFSWQSEAQKPTSFKIIKLNDSGRFIDQFIVPMKMLHRITGESIVMPKVGGYITYPVNGNYFIWYPTLGRRVYIFDQDGEFLWDKVESRYIASSESGGFIISVAGDHSRVHFQTSDLKVINNIEGRLMLKYQLAKKKDSTFSACLAFLGGSYVLNSLKTKISIRLKLAHPLKSMACDLQTGDFVLQFETWQKENKSTVKRDVIAKANVFELLEDKVQVEDLKNCLINEIECNSVKQQTGLNISIKLNSEKSEWHFIKSLAFSYPETLPLAINSHTGDVAYFEQHQNKGQLTIVDKKGNVLFQDVLLQKMLGASTSAQDWRMLSFDSFFVLHNHSHIMLLSSSGIEYVKKFSKIEKVYLEKNVIFVQTPKAVFSFFVKSESSQI